MIKIFVGFENKEKVKNLGCKWDADKKHWICPEKISDNDLNQLIELQKEKTIGFVKKLHKKNDKNNNKGFIDIAEKVGYLCEPYNEDEIREIYKKL
jgi:hypothetical protein